MASMTVWCAIHDEKEPVYDDTYLVCFECKHVFPTPMAVVNADLQLQIDLNYNTGYVPVQVRPVDKIYSCPLCLHDF
jgi:hypothetical protein